MAKSSRKPSLSDDEANEIRLVANEIMRRLYEGGQREQLDLLRMYAEIALKHIDQEVK